MKREPAKTVKVATFDICGHASYPMDDDGDLDREEGKVDFDDNPREITVSWMDPRPDPQDFYPRARIHVWAEVVGLLLPADSARKLGAALIEAADASDAARGRGSS